MRKQELTGKSKRYRSPFCTSEKCRFLDGLYLGEIASEEKHGHFYLH
jgi:hypothetical protein